MNPITPAEKKLLPHVAKLVYHLLAGVYAPSYFPPPFDTAIANEFSNGGKAADLLDSQVDTKYEMLDMVKAIKGGLDTDHERIVDSILNCIDDQWESSSIAAFEEGFMAARMGTGQTEPSAHSAATATGQLQQAIAVAEQWFGATGDSHRQGRAALLKLCQTSDAILLILAHTAFEYGYKTGTGECAFMVDNAEELVS